MQQAKKVELTVMEAVDNLAHMAEIDLYMPEEDKRELTETELRQQMGAQGGSNHPASHRAGVKETFLVILHYLKHIYEKEKGMRDPETRRAIQAILVLAQEAAQKIDRYTEIFTGQKGESITQIKEYQDLQHFYLTKLAQKFQSELVKPWYEEWSGYAEGEELQMGREGIKDLDVIRQDREYELLFIRREDGRPFFNKDLLRHLRLVGEFDNVLREQASEQPFLRTKTIEDHNLHLCAKEILHRIAPYSDDYYKQAFKLKGIGFVAEINKALMALMLAANARNLLQTTSAKSCMSYYADFQFYLRRALASQEYQKYMAHPQEGSQPFFHTLLNLCHGLCTSFFTRTFGREEMIAYIRLLIGKGGTQPITETREPFWDTLLSEDAQLRHFLKSYPNGPLLKAVDVFRFEHQLKGFDPLAQGNFPCSLYTVVAGEVHISCLRMPAPIRQEYIHKAAPVAEFDGFLNSLELKGQRHLLVNLQERTSWREHARCLALEGLEKGSSLTVVTLPKSGDFYEQSGHYVESGSAKEFISQFKEQLKSEEECGFFFPAPCKTESFRLFTDQAMGLIHTLFFEGSKSLTRQNRRDFIEIFTLFLLLKTIEECQPDSISFTCKDGVDTGAASAAEFYSFLKILSSPNAWTKDEKGFLLWMLYASALTLRERVIDLKVLERMVSSLAVVQAALETKRDEVVSFCSKLYPRLGDKLSVLFS